MNRRTALKASAAAFLGSQVSLFEGLALMPVRPALAASTPSDIQFDIGAFLAPAQTLNDRAANAVPHFPPLFNLFVPATLRRNPAKADQTVLANALNTIEAHYAFSPSGAFVHVHYGIPYFNRLPQALVQSKIPRLLSDTTRFALEESPAFPSDV